jgi:hypothetical protein
MALTHMLSSTVTKFRENQEDIKLIVVDNITAHLRHLEDLNLRTKLIHTFGKRLQSVADSQQVAVLCTNQMSTQWKSQQPGTGMITVPSLGETWSPYPAIRMELCWEESTNHRAAKISKSPFAKSEDTIAFVINSEGIR